MEAGNLIRQTPLVLLPAGSVWSDPHQAPRCSHLLGDAAEQRLAPLDTPAYADSVIARELSAKAPGAVFPHPGRSGPHPNTRSVGARVWVDGVAGADRKVAKVCALCFISLRMES